MSCFSHPAVSDLAWLVDGHYIECDFDLAPFWLADTRQRLRSLDLNPLLLDQALAECKSHFMGRYFETLFSFAIQHLSTLSIQFEHVQIQKAGETLGEVDMLVQTPDGDFHQFEIAIKFYLERPDLYPHHWIGPNKNDSLLKKVTRAREHQLAILHTESGAALLETVAKGRRAQASLLMFGRLYLALLDASSVQAWWRQSERGGWIRLSDLALLSSLCSHYVVLEKPHWLACPEPRIPIPFCPQQMTADLGTTFLQDDRAKHVCFFAFSDLNVSEPRPVFIVPDTW